jgi:hypothetical protein
MGSMEANLRREIASVESNQSSSRTELLGAIELVRRDMEILRRDMTIKLGGMLIIAVGVLLAAMRYMPHL